MAIIHCLWIGLLSGLVASRVLRGRAGAALTGSSVAVGTLGALLGGLADSWLGGGAADASTLPHSVLWPALGAGIALIAWSLAQRTVFAASAGDKPSDRA